MKRLLKPIPILFLIFILGFAPASRGNLYVVTDGYKILPDGTVLEFNQTPPNLFKKENLIWNAAKKEISIFGARNEIVAFQIIIDGPAKDISLDNQKLTGPAIIPKESISFGLEGFISFKDRFYPDIILPLDGNVISTFSIPYNIAGLSGIPDQKVGIVLVEVALPEDISAGEYTGQIFIKGSMEETLNLNLSVWDFTLPKAPSHVFEFNSYGSPVGKVLKDQRNPYHPTPPEIIAAEHEFYRCADRHRAYLNIIPVHSQRGRPLYAPKLQGKGKELQSDWSYWDERFGPVLEGSIFESGIPPPYFYLPFNLHWPWGYSHDESLEDHRLNWREKPDYKHDHTFLVTQEYLDEWQAMAQQTVTHFSKKKWPGTTFQLYLNHTNQPNSNSPWRLDEPYDRWDFQVLSYFADLTDKLFQNDLGVKVKYRLDIGHFYCRTRSTRCYKAKKYDLPLSKEGGGPQLLEPVVDMWYIGGPHVWGNRKKVDEVRNRDPEKEIFIYGGAQKITDSTTEHRSLFWYLYDFRIRGYCSWNQGCLDPELPLEKPGGDHVWYSGKKIGFKGPLPSMRMKLWRRGSFDTEYLKLADSKTSRKEVMLIFAEVCKYKKIHPKYKHIRFPYPNNNPHNFEVARFKLASIIMSKDITNGREFLGRIPKPTGGFGDQIENY